MITRFIPACAGNACVADTMGTLYSVHPRMRGERAKRFNEKDARTRFIPACAGNASRSGLLFC